MSTIRDMVVTALEGQAGCDVDDILHLESAPQRNTWYAAVRNLADVSGCVILVDLDDLNPTRIKVVFEDMGPYAFWPTAEMLDTLTPTRNETALLWRQACRTLHTGQGIIGSPYQAFSDSFLDPTGNITSFTADKERAAYRQGIEDRFAGVEMGDKEEDPLVSKYYFQWCDGWFWANNEIEVAEIEEGPSEIPMTGDREIEADDISENDLPSGIPVYFAKPGSITDRTPGKSMKAPGGEDRSTDEESPLIIKLGSSTDEGPN
ncbi:hypothetical protein [Pseudosulfitobacter pseudonitzschiae]|uniref:hypothetical protein n=1 Tax=Pseudosulfitobacter pseudonitzschiae TaxID=1402135 RepID=UPI003B7996BE